jgi:iron complex transport system substrate-binding protein
MISALGEENSVTGVSGTGFIFSESLNRNIEKGLIADVGYEANLNKELILKISPDLIMMYGIGSESAGYVGKIKELGIKVIFNADYLETDPIAKAEWIKLFGALFCKEKMADSIFVSEREAYDSIRDYISKNISDRPKVMLGLPFKDTWYISPGNSFISKLITDAGGDYLWEKTRSSVSMPYGIENVYMRALTADFWLNSDRPPDDARVLWIGAGTRDTGFSLTRMTFQITHATDSDTNAERDFIISELRKSRVVDDETSYSEDQDRPVKRINHYVADGDITVANLAVRS